MQASIFEKLKKITVDEASAKLEVSSATLRNWIRSGVISANAIGSKVFFYEEEINTFKNKLATGEIARLRRRANKNVSEARHGHVELLNNISNEPILLSLLEAHATDPNEILFAIYLQQLAQNNLCEFSKSGLKFNTHNIENEIACWNIDYMSESFQKKLNQVASAKLDLSDNLLSYAYQYLCDVGTKQKGGAYYTPAGLVKKLAKATMLKAGPVLDPCCGGGNFLIEFLGQLKALGVKTPWEYIYGADIDANAVLMARANLTLATQGQSNVVEHIKLQDTLMSSSWALKFDYILTNPPWGSKFDKEYVAKLNQKFPEVKSGESFSYFILAGMKLLSSGGTLGFVLPDSFLNVKTHADIRKAILSSYMVKEINRNEEKFSGVFTKTFTLIIENNTANVSNIIKINNGKATFNKTYQDVLSDSDCTISIDSDAGSEEILKEIESKAWTSLRGKGDWALGIVTGDNEKFLSDVQKENFEPVYKGTDVFRFKMGTPSKYLLFSQNELQQVAPLDRYRHPEKLVYRFICKELVFAIDRSGLSTLNSANILIPRVPGYSLRAVCGILNSVVGQFYYQKKFNTFKTLRGNLEKLPFPSVDVALLSQIEDVVAKLEDGYIESEYIKLNTLVIDLYKLSDKTKAYLAGFAVTETFDLK